MPFVRFRTRRLVPRVMASPIVSFFEKGLGAEGGRVSVRVVEIDVESPAEPVVAQASATVRIGFLGYGRVGQAVAELIASTARLGRSGVELRPAAALVRDLTKPRLGPGLGLGSATPIVLTTGPAAFFDRELDVVVEAMGGVHPAYEYVRQALQAGIPVVTANKSLMAEKGEELRALARRAGVPLAYEAAVVAGVPFIGAWSRRPLMGSPVRVTGILNGTSHFLTCALEGGGSFEHALAEAIDRGYAEPNSAADVSGRDAAEKLTILAHLSGCRDLKAGDITTLGVDALAPVDFRAARALGGVIKPIATASFGSNNPGAWVGPALVDARHPAALSRGVHNFLEVHHSGHSASPLTFAGPGAGPAVTAATILDDVSEVISGGLTLVTSEPRAAIGARDLHSPAAGSWFIRIRGGSLTFEDLAEHLAIHRLPAVRAVQLGDVLAVRTAHGHWSTVLAVVETLNAIGAEVVAIPVIEPVDANDGDEANGSL